jgi:predicted Zn-dependent peptidase
MRVETSAADGVLAGLMPDPRRNAPAEPPEYAERTLPNGLHVLAARRATSPIVELRLSVPFGGESPEHCATAELLTALLLAGTAWRDQDAVERDLADLGGSLRATMRPERLHITGRLLADGLAPMLELLADCLTAAAYAPGPVARERARLIERVRLADRLPQYAARAALFKHCFGAHPAARETPSAEQVATVPADALAALHRDKLVPGGSVLVLVGDLMPEQALDAAAAALTGWTGARPAGTLSRPPALAGGSVIHISRPAARQAEVRLAVPSLPRADPGYPALYLAELILGGYFSSRLVRKLREELGYVYSIQCEGEEIAGRAVNIVQFGCDPRHTRDALARVLAELDRIGGEAPPSAAEVRSASGYSRGIRSIALSTQAGLADGLLTACAGGRPVDWLTEFPARVAATGTDEVRAAASTLSAAAATGIVLEP